MLTDLDLIDIMAATYTRDVFDIASELCHVTVTQTKDAELVFAFRGSKSPLDWLLDFNAEIVTDAKIGAVHAGIWASAASVYGRIHDFIGRIPPAKRLLMVGHSKGGGEAIMMGGMLDCDGHSVEIVAAEPPRVLTHQGVYQLHGEQVRIYHHHSPDLMHGDPVPDVPLPEPAPYDYAHPVEPIKVVSGLTHGYPYWAYHHLAGVRLAVENHIKGASNAAS